MRIPRPGLSPTTARTARQVGAGAGAAAMGYLGVALGWMERERWVWRYARRTRATPDASVGQRPPSVGQRPPSAGQRPPSVGQRPRPASTAGRRGEG